jgi:hypothetical protein
MGQALFTNNAYTTLSAGCSAGDTTLTVASSSTFPAVTTASTNWFYACLQDTFANMEIVKVTNITGFVWTVARGIGGTSARAFVVGSVVELRLTAEVIAELATTSPGSGLLEHSNTISVNKTLTTGNNAISAGPITITPGVTVTVPVGSTWAVV